MNIRAMKIGRGQVMIRVSGLRPEATVSWEGGVEVSDENGVDETARVYMRAERGTLIVEDDTGKSKFELPPKQFRTSDRGEAFVKGL